MYPLWIQDVRDAMQRDDVSAMQSAMQALQNATYALSQQMYAADNVASGGSYCPNAQPNGEDVVEGDFTEA